MIKLSHFSYEYKNMVCVLVWFSIESFLSQSIVFMARQVIDHGVGDGINMSYRAKNTITNYIYICIS